MSRAAPQPAKRVQPPGGGGEVPGHEGLPVGGRDEVGHHVGQVRVHRAKSAGE